MYNLLGDFSIPLTPETIAGGYSRDLYNQAMAKLTALYEERARLMQTPEYIMAGTAVHLTILAPEIKAAEAEVQRLQARIDEIQRVYDGFTTAQLDTIQARLVFDGWFNQVFKPIFSTTFGSTTNEDTLRREVIATWAPNNPEWAEEVIQWVKSSAVAWKMAPGSEPFPVPGATSITYPDGTVFKPTQGEYAPAIPKATIDAPIPPSSSLPTAGPTDATGISTVALPPVASMPTPSATSPLPTASVAPAPPSLAITTAATPTVTTAPNVGFVTESMKWIFVAAGAVILVVLLSSRRR